MGKFNPKFIEDSLKRTSEKFLFSTTFGGYFFISHD
jgi:hypothetical protein